MTTADEHAEQAVGLANFADGQCPRGETEAYALVTALGALTHAVLALRPVPVEAPAVPEMWLDRDGDVWSEIDGVMVMLDREGGEWDGPGLYVRTSVEKNYGPLRPIPTPGVPS